MFYNRIVKRKRRTKLIPFYYWLSEQISNAFQLFKHLRIRNLHELTAFWIFYILSIRDLFVVAIDYWDALVIRTYYSKCMAKEEDERIRFDKTVDFGCLSSVAFCFHYIWITHSIIIQRTQMEFRHYFNKTFTFILVNITVVNIKDHAFLVKPKSILFMQRGPSLFPNNKLWCMMIAWHIQWIPCDRNNRYFVRWLYFRFEFELIWIIDCHVNHTVQ